jgi:hypothetical protein
MTPEEVKAIYKVGDVITFDGAENFEILAIHDSGSADLLCVSEYRRGRTFYEDVGLLRSLNTIVSRAPRTLEEIYNSVPFV